MIFIDVTDISWSPDSQLLCSSSVDCQILIWQIGEETPCHILEGHSAWISSVDWDPCGMVGYEATGFID